jgi:hypothetical protein
LARKLNKNLQVVMFLWPDNILLSNSKVTFVMIAMIGNGLDLYIIVLPAIQEELVYAVFNVGN